MATADSATEGDRPRARRRETAVLLKATQAPIRDATLKATFKRAKEIYAYGLITLFYIDEADWPNVRAGLRRYAVVRARADVVRGYLANAYLGALIALLLGGTIWVSALLDYSRKPAVLFTVPVVAFFVTMAILSVIVELTPSGTARLSTLAVMLLTPVAIIGVTLAVDHGSFQRPWDVVPRHDGQVAAAIVAGIALCAAQIAIVAVSMVLIVIIDAAMDTSLAKRRPDIVVTGTLIRLLRNLHRAPQRFDSVRVKGLVCRDLEQVAVYLQIRLPAALAVPDPLTRENLRLHCDDAATYLRQLQVRVALGDDSTASDLPVIVARYIAIFALSEYGLLPTMAAATFKRAVTARVFRVTKKLLVAVIPIGCVIAARHFGVTLAGPLDDVVVLVALLWAAVNLVSIVDPGYRARIEDMNDLVSIFRKDGD